MRTAQAAMWAHAVVKFGRPAWQPLPFGTQVRVRTRSWERFGDVWSDRVQVATVLAPSVETCKGHVVRTAAGTLMHTTALFRGAVQLPPVPVVPPDVILPAQAREHPIPLSAEAAPEVMVSFPYGSSPTHRVTGRQPPAGVSAIRLPVTGRADACALSAAAAALLSSRPVPFRTAAALIVSAPVLKDLARALPDRFGSTTSSKYLLFGWFKHGGIVGVSSVTPQLPGVVQLLNALLVQACPEATWTTLGLFYAAAASPHVDRRNAKATRNYILPLALPSTEQYLWVQTALDVPLQPLTWLDTAGSARPGFRLPLVVGEAVCVDPHSLHALPAPLPHEQASDHVLLVGFSVPWVHKATDQQRQLLQTLGFRLGLSRGGVGVPGVENDDLGASSGVADKTGLGLNVEEKILAAAERDESPGMLEDCLIAEGHQQLESKDRGFGDLLQDVQVDTAAEASVSFRGAYARRLETRDFEPADWDKVKKYLVGLGLKHLIGPMDALGVDSLEDFGFLYREDLMEAGATKEEAEAILSCTGSAQDGRKDPPPLARSGYSRPSRPAAPLRPAEAARIIRVPDRADRVRQAEIPGGGTTDRADAAANMPGLREADQEWTAGLAELCPRCCDGPS